MEIKKFESFSEEDQKFNDLLNKVDWNGLPKKNIDQIKHELKFWYKDHCDLQKLSKLTGKEIGDEFETKFNDWITSRIQMVKNG